MLLKSGCTAMKYGKSGSPHATKFVLSSDDRTLSWEGSGLIGKLIPKGEKREVELSNVRRLLARSGELGLRALRRHVGQLDPGASVRVTPLRWRQPRQHRQFDGQQRQPWRRQHS